MPGRPRLATTVWDKAIEVAQRYPNDEGVKELVVLAGSLHYGTELALAYMNRGINGDQARRLQREYERFTQQLNEQ